MESQLAMNASLARQLVRMNCQIGTSTHPHCHSQQRSSSNVTFDGNSRLRISAQSFGIEDWLSNIAIKKLDSQIRSNSENSDIFKQNFTSTVEFVLDYWLRFLYLKNKNNIPNYLLQYQPVRPRQPLTFNENINASYTLHFVFVIQFC